MGYIAWLIAQLPVNDDPHKHEQYRVPYMPYPPLIGIFVNYFLVAQLVSDTVRLVLYL